ncbi:hypothetical protein TMatcc_006419 [Talaromyces marneffei ATCC 18224]|uniref:NAD(P)-binding domain-containing protein n=2 Tax=Talaromyces marneffei TaxID=37727 RepID=B6QB16_TALMQ|nr:conserved hypothetical protein [Talaromyces marneffei ATCC 18224]KAE8554087.1 hypothetical protein EYB25_002625 [Talaromyces marneffei]
MKLAPKVLLLGGYCKVALLLTRLLIARGYDIISLTNSPIHRGDILNLRESNRQGNVEVLVTDLKQIDTVDSARALLDRVDPNYVIWMAGTGCRGGSQRSIDCEELRIAVKQMIIAAFGSSKISKFLMISYMSSRRKQRETEMTDKMWNDIADSRQGEIPVYEKEKLEAEEFLDAMTAWRRRQTHLPPNFQSIHVTTGSLSDLPARGKLSIHPEQVALEGEISRQDVAAVIAQLLARPDTSGRYGILSGEDDIETAIAKAVDDQQTMAEGAVYKNIVGGFIE